MYVYHARQQTTYILQFWAHSIQTVRECKTYISFEIRHNYTIFDFGVQCRRINATPYDMGGPVWVGDGVVRWWVMGGLRGWGLLGGSFGPCPLRPAGTYRRRQTTDIIKPSRTFRNSYDATPEIFEAPYDIRFHSVCWFPLIDPIMGYNITEIYDDTSSGIFFHPIGHSACWFLLRMTRVPQDPLRPGRTRR